MNDHKSASLLAKFQSHLDEQTQVDYLLQEIDPPALHFISLHLIECKACAEQFAAMLTFAFQNGVLNTTQTNLVEDFVNSEAYQELEEDSVRKFVQWHESRQKSKPGSGYGA